MTSREHWQGLRNVGTDLAYIAPADVLALLDRIEALEGDRERLRSALRDARSYVSDFVDSTAAVGQWPELEAESRDVLSRIDAALGVG